MISKEHFKYLLLSATLGLGLAACGDDEENDSADSGMETENQCTPELSGQQICQGNTVVLCEDNGGFEVVVACNSNQTCSDGMCVEAGEVVQVEGNITEDVTWTTGNTYVLNQLTFIDGAVLTIEPGVTVLGGQGTALVVATTGRLEAVGTPDAPIVFTSDQVDPLAGDWGGVVMLGLAPINVDSDFIEGMDPNEGPSTYGGTNADHNCGTLRYARIEYAGTVFGTDNELNGLTVGGCGTGTTLDYIQVHKGLDDGIEFFGGTANLTHAVITQPGDDALDWDQGWSGNAQFIVVQQAPGTGDRGIEADNLGSDNDAEPRSNPTVYNLTLVGGGNAEQLGMKLRRGTAGYLANVIVTNFGEDGIDIDNYATGEQMAAGNLGFDHILFFNNGEDGMATWETGKKDACTCTLAEDLDPESDETSCEDQGITQECFDEGVFLNEGGEGAVDGLLIGQDPMLGAPTDLTAPNFVPAADSPAADSTATIASGFDSDATYYGAFEPGGENWADGWTAFP